MKKLSNKIYLLIPLLIIIFLASPIKYGFGSEESIWDDIKPAAAAETEAEDTTINFDARDNFKWKKDVTLKFGEAISPAAMAVTIVNNLLMLLGIISTVLVLYAGILWFSARDNEEQLTKAKQILKGAVIGLFLVIMAYGIAYGVYYILSLATISI